jgi:hypothetical protein
VPKINPKVYVMWHDLPDGSDATTREAAHKTGVAARPGDHRTQMQDVNNGIRHGRRAGPYPSGGKKSHGGPVQLGDARLHAAKKGSK